MSKKEERRRAPRSKAQLPLEIKKEKGHIEALAVNVSSTGAYCTLDKFIPLNTKLNIALLIPGKAGEKGDELKRVSCSGVVVRNEPQRGERKADQYGMAIHFIGISQTDKQKLSKYVEQRLTGKEREMLLKKKGAVGKYVPGKVYSRGIPGKVGLKISSANFRVVGEEISLSKNGILCRTDRNIPLFREIAVNLVLPPSFRKRRREEPDAVQCSAVVVGCEKVPKSRSYDLAAYFIGLTGEQKKRLTECIENLF